MSLAAVRRRPGFALWAAPWLLWLLSLAAKGAAAATVTYDFNITWVSGNPDGQHDRQVIGINNQWPIPTIRANIGDNIVVNVLNQLGNEDTSLHFHGLFQNGTSHMDGPARVTQCNIPPGSHFTYNFTVNQPGTYWYHSHSNGQYPDGLRGPLIIHDPAAPFKYDEEVVLTVSDWYHDPMPGLISFFMSKANPTGAEPVPNAALFNDTQDLKVAVQPGKTYLFRMVNIGAFAGQYVWFEGLNMSIIEVDGIYTQPASASMIYLSAAQRCSFLLTTSNDTTANTPFVASMDTTLFDKIPDGLNVNVTGWLVYDANKETPAPALLDALEPFDDFGLVPYDNMTLLTNPDQTIELDVIMDNLRDGANYAFFNDITYKAPKVPTLYTVLSSGDQASDPRIYGSYTHSFVLEQNQTVQITLNNLDTGRHPFHLHGHHFQVAYRSAEDAGTFADSNVTEADFSAVPMRRDTIVLFPTGNLVIRFKADNPGVWLFHCHLEWHLTSGLVATFVEAPLELQKQLAGKIPQDHLDACTVAGLPTTGNAAGHTADLLDLSGQNAPPPPLPEGFETRGIVALVFSCIAGILGVAVVAWYGLADSAPPTESMTTATASPAAAGSGQASKDAPAASSAATGTAGGVGRGEP